MLSGSESSGVATLALAGRESSGSVGVERPEAGGEGSALVRAEVREARLGVGSVGLVRWGRKEKVTGKERAWEAAALAAETRAAGGSGQRRETKRESLMVRPVVQAACCSSRKTRPFFGLPTTVFSGLANISNRAGRTAARHTHTVREGTAS